MAKYYQDFVGLNTFMYEPNGYNVSASQQFLPTVYSFGREAVSHIDFFGEAGENYIYFNQNFIGATSASYTGSLAEVCGFSRDKVSIGTIESKKVIKEAVVAVPYISRGNRS